MKIQLKIASLLLSLLILFNSVGIAVYEHTCNFKKETARSLFKADSCCSKKEESKPVNKGELAFKKTKCCDTETAVFVPNVFQNASYDFKFAPASFLSFNAVRVPAFLKIENQPTFLQFSDCSGPPLSARTSLYTLYDVFLI